MPKRRKVSQAQIARALGVSQALVSLVLNGRKHGISPETYQRIWNRATQLGYTPKGMHVDAVVAARQTRQVGFILRSPLRLYTQSNFFSHAQHGLHVALEEQGVAAVFLGAEDELDAAKLDKILRPGHPLIGVVLLGEVALPFLHLLRQHDRRIVAVSAGFPGFCHSVLANEQQSVDLLVEHLVSLGHRRIGWLGGNVGIGRHTQRLRALQNALQLRGLVETPAFWIDEAEADRADGAAAVARLLAMERRKEFPTALICHNGMMARGAINALHQKGWSVPGDMTIVAIDATRIMTEEPPTITGASARPEKMGEVAARLILESTGADDESYTDLVLPAQLVPGGSSGPPKN